MCLCVIDDFFPDRPRSVLAKRVLASDDDVESPGLERAVDVALLVKVVRPTADVACENLGVSAFDHDRDAEAFGMIRDN